MYKIFIAEYKNNSIIVPSEYMEFDWNKRDSDRILNIQAPSRFSTRAAQTKISFKNTLFARCRVVFYLRLFFRVLELWGSVKLFCLLS